MGGLSVPSPQQPDAAASSASTCDFWVVGRVSVDVLPAVLHVKFFRLFHGFVTLCRGLDGILDIVFDRRPTLSLGPLCVHLEVCLDRSVLLGSCRKASFSVPTMSANRTVCFQSAVGTHDAPRDELCFLLHAVPCLNPADRVLASGSMSRRSTSCCYHRNHQVTPDTGYLFGSVARAVLRSFIGTVPLM